MGGGGGGTSISYTHFAKYIEDYHKKMLWHFQDMSNNLKHLSPYADYYALDIDPAFLGMGYTLSNFPSLYDMYGKFMAGLDVESLYNQIFNDTINGTVVNNLISAEASMLSEELEETVYPRFETGLRDMNSVLSSSFIVGKSMLENSRLKQVSKFSAELKYKLLPLVNDRWKTHLNWNNNVVNTYKEVIKTYLVAKQDVNKQNYAMLARNRLWPFTVMEYERLAVGTLHGATNTSSSSPDGPSDLSSALGGGLSGAVGGGMLGAMEGTAFGPGIGTIVGGVLGMASGLL